MASTTTEGANPSSNSTPLTHASSERAVSGDSEASASRPAELNGPAQSAERTTSIPSSPAEPQSNRRKWWLLALLTGVLLFAGIWFAPLCSNCTDNRFDRRCVCQRPCNICGTARWRAGRSRTGGRQLSREQGGSARRAR